MNPSIPSGEIANSRDRFLVFVGVSFISLSPSGAQPYPLFIDKLKPHSSMEIPKKFC